MKIEQLQFLIEVVKSGSINAASKKIFISQQSLNQSLRNLENELGFDVLNRTKRGVTLTARGREVFNGAQAIVARYEQMLNSVNSISMDSTDVIRGKLNVHTSPMISICILPVVYVDYQHSFPKVQIYCQERYQDDIVKEVSEHPGDVGYVLVANTLNQFFDSKPDNVELTLINSYQIYIAMSPRHPLAHQHMISLPSLKDYPLIIYEVGSTRSEHALQDVVDMHVLLSTNNSYMVKELLNEGKAVMYSYQPYITRGAFPDCVHIPLNTKKIVFELYMVHNKEANQQQRQLIDSFSQVFQQYI
jgi:DNA-binding transcriptional LysR family regulator